jgi:hypothetical protein
VGVSARQKCRRSGVIRTITIGWVSASVMPPTAVCTADAFPDTAGNTTASVIFPAWILPRLEQVLEDPGKGRPARPGSGCPRPQA